MDACVWFALLQDAPKDSGGLAEHAGKEEDRSADYCPHVRKFPPVVDRISKNIAMGREDRSLL